jgi:ribosome maturation factor RimP
MGKKEDISDAVTPALSALGFYLEDVTITSAGRRSMLTIIVDGDTHLSLDQVTSATPGLDRPLTKPRHWRKNIDRLVKIVLLDGKEIKGRIKAASELSATVDESEIKFSDIKRASLEVEFKQVGK